MRHHLPPSTWFIAPSAIAIVALMVAARFSMDMVLYNRSASIPIGFYLRREAPIEPGAVVTVRAISVAPAEARAQRFTDPGDRFIKRVAAVAGDEVCVRGTTVSINQRRVVRRKSRDGAGNNLSAWSGCRVLKADEILLLGDSEDSFDGRYWGPTTRRSVEGVWIPLTQ